MWTVSGNDDDVDIINLVGRDDGTGTPSASVNVSRDFMVAVVDAMMMREDDATAVVTNDRARMATNGWLDRNTDDARYAVVNGTGLTIGNLNR